MENRVYSLTQKAMLICTILAILLVVFAANYAISLSVLTLVFFMFFVPKIPRRWFPILLILFSFVVRLLIVFLIKTPPISDFSLQYQAAREFAKGGYSYLENVYFQRWGYQIGLVIYEGLLLKIVNNIYIIEVVNCILSTATVYLVYLCAKRMVSENAARLISVIWSVLVFQTLYVTVLSNSVPCTFFTVMAVYFYLSLSKKCGAKKWIICIFIGTFMALADFFWPGGILMILSLVAAEILACIRGFKKRNIFEHAFKIGIIVLSYFLLFQAISLSSMAFGFSEVGLVNNDPKWKFVVGTNIDSAGQYSNDLIEEIDQIQESMNVDRYTAESIIIKQHLKENPVKLLLLAIKKVKVYWVDIDLHWSLNHLQNMDWLVSGLTSISAAQVLLMLVSSFLGIVAFFSKRREDGHELFLLYFLATFFCYLAIEVQPRYSYTSDISVLMLGGFLADYFYAKYSKIGMWLHSLRIKILV